MAHVLCRPAPMSFVVELVNEWGDAPREAASEQNDDYPDLSRAAKRHGVVLTRLSSSDEVTRLAVDIHRVFAARTDQTAMRLVNRLLSAVEVHPRLRYRQQRIATAWAIPSAANELTAVCALALWTWLADEGAADRLGICAADRCADVFLDRSAGCKRRYCSLTCQNRTKVAAFRARR